MSDQIPHVSVLIPAYRVTEYIVEALDSVFSQTFQNFEVIVVNDGCPDTGNLEAALAPFLSRIQYIRQSNGGPSSARNTAIRAARAPLISLLDGDDAWLPDYLDYQLDCFRQSPHLDLVYPNMIYRGGPFDGKPVMDHVPSVGDVTFEALLLQSCIVLNGVTMRREAAFEAGLWDPALRHSEDFDLWVRIAFLKRRLQYHQKPLVRYRVRETSLSAVSTKMLQGQLRVYSKVLANLALSENQQVLVRSQIQKVQAELDFETARFALDSGDYKAAITHLTSAQTVLRSPKIAVAIPLIRWMPGVVASARRLGRRLRNNS